MLLPFYSLNNLKYFNEAKHCKSVNMVNQLDRVCSLCLSPEVEQSLLIERRHDIRTNSRVYNNKLTFLPEPVEASQLKKFREHSTIVQSLQSTRRGKLRRARTLL